MTMREKPNHKKLQEDFINGAPLKSKYDDSIQKNSEYNVIFEEGSNLNKPVHITLKEYEWNTIDKHVKNQKISKAQWIRNAMFKLLESEQS